MITVTLSPQVEGRVRLGVLTLAGLTVRAEDAALLAEIEAFGQETRARHAGRSSGEVPGVEEARDLYKSLGLDPTKTRPSNEALLRRVLKGEALYRVNTLVDALNLCSLREQLPFGLYDLQQVEGPVELQRGGPGAGYEGIRKGFVNVEARPVLVDARGPFGNPSSDSLRTSITLATTSSLVIAYAPVRTTPARLGQVLDATTATLTRHCGGQETGRALV